MAAVLEIEIRGKDGATKVFRDTQTAAQSFGNALSDVSKMATGFALGDAFTRAPGILMDAVKAASEDAASQARLKTAVENTGASYATYGKQIDEVISKGQNLGFQDDQTRSALSILTAQTGSAEEAMKRYAIAQDLSRGANIDVVMASRLLGKVTEENVNVLNRYGIAVQKGTSESQLFAAIQQKFGGQAAAYADTAAGKMAIFNDRVHEAQESVGYLATPVMTNLLNITINAIDHAMTLGSAYKSAVQSAADTVNKSQGADFLGIKVSASNLDILQHAVLATIPGLALLSQQSKKNTTDMVDFTAATSDLERHLNGLGTAATEAANKQSLLVQSQIDSIRASGDSRAATESAWKELEKSTTASDKALVATHEQELADQAAAKAATAASKAKSEQAAAQAEFDKTLDGHIARLQKDAEESDISQQAMVIWAASMGHATDRMNNLLPSMNDLVKAKLDSYDATQRDNEANREANAILGLQTDINGKVIKSFQQMVEEQKASILDSQQMSKATAEANKQLKDSGQLIDDTASSLNSLSSSLDKATAGWHQMTDAESQSAAKANATNSGNTKGNVTNSSGVATPAYSGGSVAFFSSGYGSGGQTEYQRQQALGGGNQGAYLSGLQAYQAGRPTSADWHYDPNSPYNNMLSHAGGLPYVPYDGYPAILHKGEAVVTAAQNANGGGNVVINVNVSGSINGVDDVKRIIRETLSGGGLRGYSFG